MIETIGISIVSRRAHQKVVRVPAPRFDAYRQGLLAAISGFPCMGRLGIASTNATVRS
jgi:hypothetical protein